MALPLLEILQMILENQPPANNFDQVQEEIDDLKINQNNLNGQLFGEYKIIRIADDWNPDNYRKIFVPGALSYLFGYSVSDGSNPPVIYKDETIYGPGGFISGNISIKTVDGKVILEEGFSPDSSLVSNRNTWVSRFSLNLQFSTTQINETDSKDTRYDYGTAYPAPFIGEIDVEDIENFDVVTSYNIVNSPDAVIESPFTGIDLSITTIFSEIGDIQAELVNLDTRIKKLITSPTNETEIELNGKRIFPHEFWNLANIEEVEGLEEKLNLFDSKLSSKMESLTANPGTGIVINSSDPQNPVIISNNPTNYYNKTVIDSKFNDLKNGVPSGGDTLNKLYNLIQSGSGITVIDNLLSTSSTSVLSANQGRILKNFIDGINTLLNSDNINLDSLQEIVDYIENHQSIIDGITTNKVNVSDIINVLTDTSTNKPLSAAQGKALKDLADSLSLNKVNVSDIINVLTDTSTNKPLSAAQGKVLKDLIDSVSFGSIPIGTPIPVWDNITGVPIPDSSKFIKLSKDLTGSGQYNENKLTGQATQTSGQQRFYTAVINDIASPIYGQLIVLMNSTEDISGSAELAPTVLSASEISLQLRANRMQNHSHGETSGFQFLRYSFDGGEAAGGGGLGKSFLSISGPTSNGFGNIRSDKTNEQNNVTASFYLRIK